MSLVVSTDGAGGDRLKFALCVVSSAASMATTRLFDGSQIIEGGPVKEFFPDFGEISFVDVEEFMVP